MFASIISWPGSVLGLLVLVSGITKRSQGGGAGTAAASLGDFCLSALKLVKCAAMSIPLLM